MKLETLNSTKMCMVVPERRWTNVAYPLAYMLYLLILDCKRMQIANASAKSSDCEATTPFARAIALSATVALFFMARAVALHPLKKNSPSDMDVAPAEVYERSVLGRHLSVPRGLQTSLVTTLHLPTHVHNECPMDCGIILSKIQKSLQ